MTGTDVPAEAVQAIVAAIPNWSNVPAVGSRGNTFADDVRMLLAAAAEAGWVLVPGPVRTEWATRYGGFYDDPTIWENERAARLNGNGEVVARQVTEWRPAPEPTPDGAA